MNYIIKKKEKIPKKIILYGGTAQAKLVRPIIEYYGSKVVAVFDDTIGLKSPFGDVNIYRGLKGLIRWADNEKIDQVGFCVTIGNPNGKIRRQISEKLISLGLVPITIVHPSVLMAEDAMIGVGCQILAGAIISPDSRLDKYCIVNQNAIVGCSSILSAGVELGPAANICGEVIIKKDAWIGASATLIPKVKIGESAIIGAGAVVIDNLPANCTAVGMPAKIRKE